MVFHSYEDISNDICCDHIIFAVDFISKFFVRGDITVKSFVLIWTDVILFCIFQCSFRSILFDIHSNCIFCTEQDRTDGQDTAAAAKIKDSAAIFEVFFDKFQTQPCGMMSTCSEAGSRVYFQNDSAVGIVEFLP